MKRWRAITIFLVALVVLTTLACSLPVGKPARRPTTTPMLKAGALATATVQPTPSPRSSLPFFSPPPTATAPRPTPPPALATAAPKPSPSPTPTPRQVGLAKVTPGRSIFFPFGSIPPTPAISLGKAEVKDPDPKKLIQTKTWGEVPANQALVILKDGQTRQDAEKVASGLGGTIVGEVEFIGLYQIETRGATEADLKAAVDKAGAIPGVKLAFPNAQGGLEDLKCVACGPLADPTYGEGENGRAYEMIGLKRAWDLMKLAGVKLSDVHVGVVDDALYKKSDEISGKVKVSGLEAQDSTDKAATDNAGKVEDGGLSHGTMVVHTIGADLDNSGVAGVAGNLGERLKITVRNTHTNEPDYKQARPDPKDPTKLVWSDGKAYVGKTFVDIIKQIEAGATVINMSFWQGTSAYGAANAPYAAAYRDFFEKMNKKYPRVLFVASAGNSGKSLDGNNHLPGGIRAPNLISAGALDNQGHRAKFSNYATGDGEVTISAPAVEMALGVGPDGKTVNASGTSFASPQVAAAAALIRSINPKLTAEEIKKVLVDTAAPGVPGEKQSVPIPQGMGKGVLRVDEAVLKAINDLRKAEGKPLLDGKLLEKLASIEGSATSDEPTEFKVTATLGAVPEGGAEVSIELRGEGMIWGSSKKRLTAPGSASWDVVLLEGKPSPTVRLCRLDSQACCDIVLGVDLAGLWKGTATLVSYSMAHDITIPDPLGGDEPIVVTKEDCEKQGQQSMGKAQPWALEFKPQAPDSGMVVIIGTDAETGEEERQGPWPYRYTGDKVIADFVQNLFTIHLEGQVEAKEKELVLTGSWVARLIAEGEELLTMTADFTVSKPK